MGAPLRAPVLPGGPPHCTLLLLLLLPPLALLPQLQGVRAPPLLPCRLLPPEGKGREAELGGGEETRVKGAGAASGGSACTCCSVPSPRLLPQGSTLVAVAPEDRTAGGLRGSPKPALARSLRPSHGRWTRDSAAPHLAGTSLLILPRHVAVDEVDLLRVSVS